jgi:hypothetical protein
MEIGSELGNKAKVNSSTQVTWGKEEFVHASGYLTTNQMKTIIRYD